MALTPTEQELAASSGVGEAACAALKQAAKGKKLRRAEAFDEMMRAEPADGVAVDVADGEAAERVIVAITPDVATAGCRPFWSNRHRPNVLAASDEVVVLKTADPYAIVRIRQTSGENYDVSHADVLDRLRAWESLCSFACVGADHDWVALQFKTLPDNLCTFAAEVYTFCPDAIEQGVGLAKESRDPELFAAARALCPEVPSAGRDRVAAQLAKLQALGDRVPAFLLEAARAAAASSAADDGIRLLAEDIRRRRYLFLWWD